jgi:arylsulfatase
MNRRTFLGAAGAGFASARAAQPAQSDRPNILLLMTDQHRGDTIGAAGNRAVHTPNMDRLAAGGVRFRCAYSSTPTCTPARAALLTGMSPWSHGMLGYFRVAEKYPVEMPHLLRDAGYYTLGIGKMHWTPQRSLHGFHKTILDESGRIESVDFRSDYRSWFWSEMPDGNPDASGIDWNGYAAATYPLPDRMHPTSWIGETAVRFLKDYQRKEPFFLKVSFERPHSPYDPPRRWFDYYREADLLPVRAGRWADNYRTPSSSRPDIWHGDLGPQVARNARQGYYGSISYIDEQFGRILETLDARGMLRRTLILFCADHGDMLNDQYLWRKSYAYEPSAHIPMIVHWPEGFEPKGEVRSNPVEIRDVLPTFLDAAGIAAPPAVEGRSLLTIARNPHAEWRPWIDLEHDVCYSVDNHWNALTDGRWKFIFHANSGEEQLFDLSADPYELEDLAGDANHGRELNLWRSRLVEHLAARGEPWVVGGKLGVRHSSQLKSPNYPGTSS